MASAKQAAQLAFDSAIKSPLFVDKFSVALQPLVADSSKRFVVQEKHLPTRSEKTVLKTTRAGLLSSVQSEVVDQTQEIVVALAQSLAAVRTSSTNSRVISGVRTSETKCTAPSAPIKIEQLINPLDHFQLDKFLRTVNAARCKKENLPFRFGVLNASINNNVPEAKLLATGIAYRRELPVVISIFETEPELSDAAQTPAKGEATSARATPKATARSEQNLTNNESPVSSPADLTPSVDVAAGSAATVPSAASKVGPKAPADGQHHVVQLTCASADKCAPVASFALELPNASPVEVLPMVVGPFGKVNRKAEFENGMLMSLDGSQESELTKVAKLPFEVLKATTEAISEVLQLKVDLSGKKTSLAEAEKKRAEAEKLLEDTIELIRAAREAPAGESNE